MSNGVTVLDLLDEMEEIIETASTVPLTAKVVVEAEEMQDLIKKTRESLPDDVQQARWIRNEKERILSEAKQEYTRIIMEAKKEADRLVEDSIILRRARSMATGIYEAADDYSEEMTLKTYDYMESAMRNMEERIADMDDHYRETMQKYIETMDQYHDAMQEYNSKLYNQMTSCFNGISSTIERDREEIIELSEDVSARPKPVHKISVDFDSE